MTMVYHVHVVTFIHLHILVHSHMCKRTYIIVHTKI